MALACAVLLSLQLGGDPANCSQRVEQFTAVIAEQSLVEPACMLAHFHVAAALAGVLPWCLDIQDPKTNQSFRDGYSKDTGAYLWCCCRRATLPVTLSENQLRVDVLYVEGVAAPRMRISADGNQTALRVLRAANRDSDGALADGEQSWWKHLRGRLGHLETQRREMCKVYCWQSATERPMQLNDGRSLTEH